MDKYHLLTPGNGHQAGNKRLAMKIVGRLFDATDPTHESMRVPGWGDCQVAAYTSKAGAMIINAADPKKYGELPWHHRDHLILLREIPDPKTPRCVLYICKIKDLFDAPRDQWIGKAGVKWAHVGNVALRKQIYPTSELIAIASASDQPDSAAS